MWACCCHCGNAGVSEQVCMFPHQSCGKLGAFSRDSQIQWLFSVSPSYHWLCGMKATGSQLGPMVLSSSLLEGVLVSVRRTYPKAAPFYRHIPKSLFQVPLNWAGNYSWENLWHGLLWVVTNVQYHSGNVGEAEVVRASPKLTASEKITAVLLHLGPYSEPHWGIDLPKRIH